MKKGRDKKGVNIGRGVFFKPLDDRLKAILQNRGRIRQKCRKVIKNSKLKEKCCRERER
jgi:hypothetical protein